MPGGMCCAKSRKRAEGALRPNRIIPPLMVIGTITAGREANQPIRFGSRPRPRRLP